MISNYLRATGTNGGNIARENSFRFMFTSATASALLFTSEAIKPETKNKMKIKINEQNRAALQIALAKSNGKATAHTFRHVIELIARARDAEAKLQHISLKKGSRSGAIATAKSGGSVANAYKYSRITSTATMVRGSSAWFLTSLTCSETFRKSAGDTFVSLTPAQDAEVIATFRSQFGKQEVVK